MLNLKPPIYSKKTVKLAFEFAIILSEVAKERKVVLTEEIVSRAEDIFLNEIKTKGMKKTALNFIPLILATLEV